jgi:isonocardicin synthase
MLGCGEERIRAYSIQFLRSVGLDKPILYDPACSTGVFLSTLQQAIPGSYTIGQDLSQQMANFAKDRVDEAHCANALDPKIKLGTADAVYIRFLNSEVIKTCEAEELLSALLPTVKKGGYIITFGHTPVLLSSSNFRQLSGFQFKQSVGVAVDKCGIFQYYAIQKS